MDIHPLLLTIFGIVIIIMLLLDLGVFSRKDHVVTTKEATIWTCVWISLSMAFSVFVYYDMGWDAFAEYQSAYWVEESLSIDNLFVFVLAFNQMRVPKELRHRVLYYGVIGAIVFRAIFIFAGYELIQITYLDPFTFMGYHFEHFNIVLFIFGLFLLYAGLKSALPKEDKYEEDFEKGFAARLVRKFFRVSNQYDGHKFFTVKNGVKYATPLFLVLVIIEFSDIIFAVDSIPAIFSISKDPIILYTSNIFAILGLRSLYFVLANIIDTFRHLKYALAAILVFIGAKMILEPFFEVPPTYSLIVIASLLTLAIVSSKIFPAKKTLPQQDKISE